MFVYAAIVYGRHGGGLTKKRFKLIDLWECKVSNETESMPGVISAVANSNRYRHSMDLCWRIGSANRSFLFGLAARFASIRRSSRSSC